jgi:hypothetical protein
MGNKDIARELALKSNIPICPGISNITKLNSDDLKISAKALDILCLLNQVQAVVA